MFRQCIHRRLLFVDYYYLEICVTIHDEQIFATQIVIVLHTPEDVLYLLTGAVRVAANEQNARSRVGLTGQLIISLVRRWSVSGKTKISPVHGKTKVWSCRCQLAPELLARRRQGSYVELVDTLVLTPFTTFYSRSSLRSLILGL